MQRTIPTFTRRTLGVALAAAFGVVLFPAQPVLAGMGTGRPQPPPPPPRDVEYRVYEASQDLDLQNKGYANVVVSHARSSYNNSTSCVTGANGAFKYIIRQGDTISHRARLFGITSNFTSGDIVISSNARLEIKVASGETDFDEIGDPAKGIVTRWKMGVKTVRGEAGEDAAAPTEVTLNTPDMNTRSFGTQFVARHLAANPLGTTASQQKVTYKIVSLVGFDASGAPRLRWVDNIKNGEIQLTPGQSTSISLNKIVAVTEK